MLNCLMMLSSFKVVDSGNKSLVHGGGLNVFWSQVWSTDSTQTGGIGLDFVKEVGG